jgi:peroxiredoxin Q/BCP
MRRANTGRPPSADGLASRARLDSRVAREGEKEVRMLKVGEMAPEFDALTHTGQRLHLSDFRGRSVVLWFYPKADTPG